MRPEAKRKTKVWIAKTLLMNGIGEGAGAAFARATVGLGVAPEVCLGVGF
jgi:hypothetical protein